MGKYDDEVFLMLTEITIKHLNCVDDYDNIVIECPKKIMSRGIGLYGMFHPDNEITKYFTYKGRITKNKNKRDYVYHFDVNGRLRLTERYADDILLDYIFYYYYENLIEIVWYNIKDKTINQVGFIEYKNKKISRFVESFHINGLKIFNSTKKYYLILNFYLTQILSSF